MEIIREILKTHGLRYVGHSAVTGGDINATYKVETPKGSIFLKVNNAGKYPAMFEKEAEGLQALRQATLLKVPVVIGSGELLHQQYLLLEYLQTSSADTQFWRGFAEGLAQLHRISNDDFGWPSSNYIGSLQQQNTPAKTWHEFYATRRVLPFVKRLFDDGKFSTKDIIHAEALCKQLENLFPTEPPSLLHGDLWAGNFMVAKDDNNEGISAIYDPAVYFGHREMDIGMSLLFGGFDSSFYNYYHEYFPLEKNWKQRVSLTQLSPLLVHAVLFGGGYVQQCKNIVQQWQ